MTDQVDHAGQPEWLDDIDAANDLALERIRATRASEFAKEIDEAAEDAYRVQVDELNRCQRP